MGVLHSASIRARINPRHRRRSDHTTIEQRYRPGARELFEGREALLKDRDALRAEARGAVVLSAEGMGV
jgi:hypothetical protein